jgi:hypothetical protein
MAADTQAVTEEPNELAVTAEIAKVLGVSKRTLIRWSSAEVSDPIPRHLRTIHRIERACLNWADVLAYCERNHKTKEIERLRTHLGMIRTPDPVLSEWLAQSTATPSATPAAVPLATPHPSVAVPVATTVSLPQVLPTAQTRDVAVPLAQTLALPNQDNRVEELSAELREVRAGRAELVKQVSELATSLVESRQGEAVLRETVKQLQQRLTTHKERLVAEVANSKERLSVEVERRLEERTRLDAQLHDLQISHDKEVQRLVNQLGVRQDEATEMRQATERQQQREVMLRALAAKTEQQRDFALAELGSLNEASAWKRLFWRPSRALTASETQPTDVIEHIESDGGDTPSS